MNSNILNVSCRVSAASLLISVCGRWWRWKGGRKWIWEYENIFLCSNANIFWKLIEWKLYKIFFPMFFYITYISALSSPSLRSGSRRLSRSLTRSWRWTAPTWRASRRTALTAAAPPCRSAAAARTAPCVSSSPTISRIGHFEQIFLESYNIFGPLRLIFTRNWINAYKSSL